MSKRDYAGKQYVQALKLAAVVVLVMVAIVVLVTVLASHGA